MFKSTWHSLPKWLQDSMQPTNKTSITINAYKNEDGWAFNMLPYTWAEALFVDDILDVVKPGSDTATIIATTYQREGAYQLEHVTDDGGSGDVYSWDGIEVWLCAFNRWYFNGAPKQLWFSVS